MRSSQREDAARFLRLRGLLRRGPICRRRLRIRRLIHLLDVALFDLLHQVRAMEEIIL
jgi:hypothetical protein